MTLARAPGGPMRGTATETSSKIPSKLRTAPLPRSGTGSLALLPAPHIRSG